MVCKYPVPSTDALRALRRLTSCHGPSPTNSFHGIRCYGTQMGSRPAQSSKRRLPVKPSIPLSQSRTAPETSRCSRRNVSTATARDPQSTSQQILSDSGLIQYRPDNFQNTPSTSYQDPGVSSRALPSRFPKASGRYRDPEYFEDLTQEYWSQYLMKVRHEKGHREAARQLRFQLLKLVDAGSKDAWTAAKSHFAAMCAHIYKPYMRKTSREVVEKMLKLDPPRLEAIELLHIESVSSPSYQVFITRIEKYLEWFCKKASDMESKIAEAEKCLQAMRHCQISPSAVVIRPLLRSATKPASLSRAIDFFEVMKRRHHLKPTLPVYADILRAYAVQRNWSRVDEMLLDLQRQGFPRTHAKQFTTLFDRLLRRFADDYSADQFYDYLLFCVKNYSVISTPRLAIVIHTKLLQHKRFDLMQKWQKTQKQLFPGLQSLSSSPKFLVEIALKWSGFNASCVDILETCKALAYPAVRNTSSDTFRKFAYTALREDILARCQIFFNSIGYSVDMLNLSSTYNIDHLLQKVLNLIELSATRAHIAKRELHKADFMEQVFAAQQTVLLLEDVHKYMNTFGTNLEVGQRREVPSNPETPPEQHLDRELNRRWNSDRLTDLLATINELYTEDESQNKPINDGILIRALTSLSKDLRYKDISRLLVYLSSPPRASKIFSPHVYQLWAYAVLQDPRGTWGHFVPALWHIVDSKPSLPIPLHLILLLQVCQQQLHHLADADLIEMTVEKQRELNYLIDRLVRRRWYQRGCPGGRPEAELYKTYWARHRLDFRGRRMKEDHNSLINRPR